jgi:hypothetical protein
MQILKPLLSSAPIGLKSKGRLLAFPTKLYKGGRLMIMTNTLAYDDTATITTVKSLIVQGTAVLTIKNFMPVIYATSQ